MTPGATVGGPPLDDHTFERLKATLPEDITTELEVPEMLGGDLGYPSGWTNFVVPLGADILDRLTSTRGSVFGLYTSYPERFIKRPLAYLRWLWPGERRKFEERLEGLERILRSEPAGSDDCTEYLRTNGEDPLLVKAAKEAFLLLKLAEYSDIHCKHKSDEDRGRLERQSFRCRTKEEADVITYAWFLWKSARVDRYWRGVKESSASKSRPNE